MRLRTAASAVAWFLKLLGSNAEDESLIGDLLEQYQRRGRLWYWRQVVSIVFMKLYRKALRVLTFKNGIPLRQISVVVLFIAVLGAVLLSDIWVLVLAGILGGIIAGTLIFLFGHGQIEPRKFAAGPTTDPSTYHPGISISHIPVEGAVGLLFVFGTVFIFGVGLAPVREILFITGPLGIVALGILLYWHNRHPLKIQALDLHEKSGDKRELK
jgi:hypothetical protein